MQEHDNARPASPTRFAVEGLVFEFERVPTPRDGRVAVTVRLEASPDARAFVDRADLYSVRMRRRFARDLSISLGRDVDALMGVLAVLLDVIEREQTPARDAEAVVLSPERERAADALLRTPDLLDRAAAVMDQLGYVGESINKRLAYLVATSRLLPRPLSALLVAPSSSGKSELLETVAQLLPAEQVHRLSRITKNALYYQREDALKNALVIVDEQDGAADANHAVRLLQSAGELRVSVTRNGQANEVTVRGPVAFMSGTTSHSLDPQNVSRCVELCLDDSAEQTARVLDAQRHAWAGDGPHPVAVEAWVDAQRLLRPLAVTIPFAKRLVFPSLGDTRARRDQPKHLALIAAHALLAQRQRARDASGRLVAMVADYRAVFPLWRHLLDHAVDGLSARAGRVFHALKSRESTAPVTRDEVARLTSTSYMTALRALDELVRRELATETSNTPRLYHLVPSADAPTSKLIDPDELDGAA